jgi:hypothetical protein
VSGDGPEYEDEYEDEDEARDDSGEDGDDDVDMEEEPSEQDGINLELFNYYGWAGHSHAVSEAQPQTYDASRAACGGENTWIVVRIGDGERLAVVKSLSSKKLARIFSMLFWPALAKRSLAPPPLYQN